MVAHPASGRPSTSTPWSRIGSRDRVHRPRPPWPCDNPSRNWGGQRMTLERYDRSGRSVARKVAETMFSAHAAVFVLVNLLCLFIWAAAGFGYFWPVWVFGPWGFALGVHAWVTWGLPYQTGRSIG